MVGLKRSVSVGCAVTALFGVLALRVFAFDDEEPQPDDGIMLEQGCTFRANPDEFLQAQTRARVDAFNRARNSPKGHRNAARAESGRVFAVAASSLPKTNFVDDAILGSLEAAGVPAAPLSSDYEYVRRIYLDLTGRIPSADEIRGFVADSNPKKRDNLVEKLLASSEFTDKWSVWFMDLVGMTESPATNRRPQTEGRNAFNRYIRAAIGSNKPIKEIVVETVTGKGNNYEVGPANFPILASAPMGPVQDTYDLMLYKTAASYLGMAHYDCLLCHNGRGHLDQISVWATRMTRSDAQRMSAHFSRMALNNGAPGVQQNSGDPKVGSTLVADNPAGAYALNTTSGNRPYRCAQGSVNGTRCTSTATVLPEYRDGTTPGSGGNWREAFAAKLIEDPMFARNFANRIWKAVFNLGLVDPVDTLDPDRLDPKNPPAAPWTLQASHPELLEKLAGFFVQNNTDMRAIVRLLVTSTAYQLSSDYDGEWKLEYVPLFARHYPRRLDAEELHDAVVKATGVMTNYTWPLNNATTVPRGTPLTQSEPVQWAMQLPDINEPRANTNNARSFMNAFGRGNRDTTPRFRSGSILQQLTIMNDSFVTNKARVSASPVLQRIAQLTDNQAIVEEMYLTFLSRLPKPEESAKAVAFLAKAATPTQRNTALEDLAWACINKIEFVFSY